MQEEKTMILTRKLIEKLNCPKEFKIEECEPEAVALMKMTAVGPIYLLEAENCVAYESDDSITIYSAGEDVELPSDSENLFGGSSFTSIDLTNAVFDKVTNMACMFRYAHAKRIILGKKNICNVTTMKSMFEYCEITELDLKDILVSCDVKIKNMFFMCYAKIDVLNLSPSMMYVLKIRNSKCEKMNCYNSNRNGNVKYEDIFLKK